MINNRLITFCGCFPYDRHVFRRAILPYSSDASLVPFQIPAASWSPRLLATHSHSNPGLRKPSSLEQTEIELTSCLTATSLSWVPRISLWLLRYSQLRTREAPLLVQTGIVEKIKSWEANLSNRKKQKIKSSRFSHSTIHRLSWDTIVHRALWEVEQL